MRKLLIMFLIVTISSFTYSLPEKKINSFSDETLAADVVGYFTYGGVEYKVFAYLPNTTVAGITYMIGNTQYSGYPFSGFWYSNPMLSVNISFIDINGNNASYNGSLYQ